MEQSKKRVLLAVIAILGIVIFGFIYFSAGNVGTQAPATVPQNDSAH